MHQIEISYEGDLRTKCIHLQSGNTIITDAPLDNQGKGEAFSPTDLACAALGSCMLTIMGIAARSHRINMDGSSAKVTKTMSANPRRIAKIIVEFNLPQPLNQKAQTILRRAAESCPVHHSLHPDVEKEINFKFHEMGES